MPAEASQDAIAQEGPKESAAPSNGSIEGEREPSAPGDQSTRSFYNLYLLSEAPTEERPRGEFDVYLQHIKAGTAARMLELLYVPVGRSGSPSASYLLFENKDEFDAASRIAVGLDVPASKGGTPAASPEEAFREGIGLFATIIDAGAIVDRALVDTCEKRLAEAAQSTSLPADQAWAAAILAGRVVAEYRYDYPAARSYFAQAERLAPTDLEKMTAAWWRADTLAQEGRRSDAADSYALLLDAYEEQWPKAQIIRRSEAILAGREKK